MFLLALDTSTPAVTVALHDGDRVVAEKTTVDHRRHTELLMPHVVEVLSEAGADRHDITDIAVGVGPGPFTGLRVGVSAARVVAEVLDVPIHGVCSLDIIAAQVIAETGIDTFNVATDARRREVYWARYEAGDRVAEPQVNVPADVPDRDKLPTAGAGARRYAEAFRHVISPEYPTAAWLANAVVNRTVRILDSTPLYLRRPDAVPAKSRKSVLT